MEWYETWNEQRYDSGQSYSLAVIIKNIVWLLQNDDQIITKFLI